jgi:hypothetical protein
LIKPIEDETKIINNVKKFNNNVTKLSIQIETSNN